MTDRDRLATAIDTVRFLAVDMVEKAKSGHPGAPLGQAPLATVLWTEFLRHTPEDAKWPGRDRFVLSCGHASALLYSLLHLAGYDLPIAELERFRQLGSRTPGHPENFLTHGVETTTGPLGQGFGNAVGMAMAQRLLAARYGTDGAAGASEPAAATTAPGGLFDYRVWVIASDGDLMEGVASEAASLAGHQRLAALKVFWDDNHISIDGSTSLSFSEDVCARFAAYGWRVERVADGNDVEALRAAMRAAADERERPTFVAVRTHIGFGSPNKQDSAEAHGSPLGGEEVKLTKQALGWPTEPTFLVPEEARALFAEAAARNREGLHAWRSRYAAWRAGHMELAAELEIRWERGLPDGWDANLPSFAADAKPIATRSASGKVLNALAKNLPYLVGGSADLTPSNNTYIDGSPDFSPTHPAGRNLRFGVREHAMGSTLNGLALSGVHIPYGGTFLIFSDYMRPAIRLAALMGVQAIYVFTHDSIFLGEDGPTHQPIGQLSSLRAIPNLVVLRPADARETVAAWRVAIARTKAPTALLLTRQNLPVLAGTETAAAAGVERGAYILVDPEDRAPEVLLLATGSEVSLAVAAHGELAAQGVAARVVSMPSWELFAAQPPEYRESVLPRAVRKRLAIEAASPLGWHRWVGDEGDVMALEGYGASAPYQDLARHYGFVPEEVVRRVRALLGG